MSPNGARLTARVGHNWTGGRPLAPPHLVGTMSKFFGGGSDSDSDSELESSSEEEFESGSELESSEEESSSDDEANAFLASDSDDSSSDDDRRVVRSAKDKRFDQLRAACDALTPMTKNNDWIALLVRTVACMSMRCARSRSVGRAAIAVCDPSERRPCRIPHCWAVAGGRGGAVCVFALCAVQPAPKRAETA